MSLAEELAELRKEMGQLRQVIGELTRSRPTIVHLADRRYHAEEVVVSFDHESRLALAKRISSDRTNAATGTMYGKAWVRIVGVVVVGSTVGGFIVQVWKALH